MKIAIVADLHIGNHRVMGGDMVGGVNQRCHDALNALDAAICEARNQGCDKLFVAGDIFDTDRPSPAIMARVMNLMMSNELPFILINGNHDTTSKSETALAPLQWLDNLGVFTERAGIGCFDGGRNVVIALPFGCAPSDIVSTFGKEKFSDAAVVSHFGLYDDSFPPWLKGASGAMHVNDLLAVMKEIGVRFWFSGDFHSHRAWVIDDYRIVQIGALCPTDFGDEQSGGMVIYDTKAGSIQRIEIPGPRFLTAKFVGPPCGTAVEYGWLPSDYIRIVVKTPESVYETKSWLSGLVESLAIRGGEVVIDASMPRWSTSAAVDAAREAGNVQQAVHEFVDRMPLAEGVARADVVSQSLDFLKGK